MKSTLLKSTLLKGDLGYYSKAGLLYIVDRIKDLLKYNALQVNCFMSYYNWFIELELNIDRRYM